MITEKDKGNCKLIITGISKQRAVELTEEFAGGSMMWDRSNGRMTAYPSGDSEATITGSRSSAKQPNLKHRNL